MTKKVIIKDLIQASDEMLTFTKSQRVSASSIESPLTQSMVNLLARPTVRHLVMPNDTLSGLSLSYGVPARDIKRRNQLWTDSDIQAHEFLDIPLLESESSKESSQESLTDGQFITKHPHSRTWSHPPKKSSQHYLQYIDTDLDKTVARLKELVSPEDSKTIEYQRGKSFRNSMNIVENYPDQMPSRVSEDARVYQQRRNNDGDDDGPQVVTRPRAFSLDFSVASIRAPISSIFKMHDIFKKWPSINIREATTPGTRSNKKKKPSNMSDFHEYIDEQRKRQLFRSSRSLDDIQSGPSSSRNTSKTTSRHSIASSNLSKSSSSSNAKKWLSVDSLRSRNAPGTSGGKKVHLREGSSHEMQDL